MQIALSILILLLSLDAHAFSLYPQATTPSKHEYHLQLARKERSAKRPRPSKEGKDSEGNDGASYGRYMVAQRFESYLGFGSGHAILGTWTNLGWLFTFAEVACVAGFVYGLLLYFDEQEIAAQNNTTAETVSTGTVVMVVSGVTYIIFRIWEGYNLSSSVREHNGRYFKTETKGSPQFDLGFASLDRKVLPVATLNVSF